MVNYVRVCGAYAKLHVRTALEYRANFLAQAGFMLLNDALMIAALYLLMGAFGSVQGYAFRDIGLLAGMSMFSFGLVGTFFGGVHTMGDDIENGALDGHLSTPLPSLFSIGISGSQQDSYGDLLLGAIVITALAENPVIALLVSTVAFPIWIALFIVMGSLPLYLERSSRLAMALRSATVGFSMWPINAYRPLPRMLLYATLIAFLSTVPAVTATEFTWTRLGIMAVASTLAFTVAFLIFKAGVRRYESGNLMGMRG